jgi:hypothetical protein
MVPPAITEQPRTTTGGSVVRISNATRELLDRLRVNPDDPADLVIYELARRVVIQLAADYERETA